MGKCINGTFFSYELFSLICAVIPIADASLTSTSTLRSMLMLNLLCSSQTDISGIIVVDQGQDNAEEWLTCWGHNAFLSPGSYLLFFILHMLLFSSSAPTERLALLQCG